MRLDILRNATSKTAHLLLWDLLLPALSCNVLNKSSQISTKFRIKPLTRQYEE